MGNEINIIYSFEGNTKNEKFNVNSKMNDVFKIIISDINKDSKSSLSEDNLKNIIFHIKESK